MKLKAQFEFEYDTGSEEDTLVSYGTADPELVASIDCNNFIADPFALFECAQGSVATIRVTAVAE